MPKAPDALADAPRPILHGAFVLKSRDRRFRRLFAEAASRPPSDVPRIKTVRVVQLSKKPTKVTVGLTRYSRVRYFLFAHPRQTITFYSYLFDALSERAGVAVIAHELAHAWLNEHQGPEESRRREKEADDLARKWGFGPELDALDREAETVNS